MDFDKIKKAARNTIKMVSNKVEETFLRPDEDEDMIELKSDSKGYDDFDDFTEADDFMGQTQRFDMKDALNRFRKHKDELESNISNFVKNDDAQTKEDSAVNDFFESNFTDLKKDISESISDIDTDISNLSARYSHEMTKVEKDIARLEKSIDKVTSISEKTDSSLNELSDNLESAIMDINKKLSEISSSISGVNKINDSIFDLKNSQINTKNVLGDLEVAFRRLKKKMTAGVTILSIISAIVVVLEVINLLS